MSVTILDSLDGDTFVDNTREYANEDTLSSNDVYKIDVRSPVHSIKVRATRTDPTNAVDLKVLAPNK